MNGFHPETQGSKNKEFRGKMLRDKEGGLVIKN